MEPSRRAVFRWVGLAVCLVLWVSPQAWSQQASRSAAWQQFDSLLSLPPDTATIPQLVTLASRQTMYDLTLADTAALVAQRLALRLRHPRQLGRIYISRAVNALNRGQNDTAQVYVTLAREHADAKRDSSVLGNALIFSGQLASRAGDPMAALQHYTRALALYRQQGKRKAQSSVLAHLSGVYVDQNRGKEAIRFAREGLDIARELGDTNRILLNGSSLTNLLLGAEEVAADDLAEGVALAKEMHTIALASGMTSRQLRTIRSLGKAYEMTDRYQDAIAVLEEAAELELRVSGRRYADGHTAERLAAMHGKLNDRAAQLNYLRLALPGTRAYAPARLRVVYEQFGEAFAATGRFDSAYFYAQELVVLRDSIYHADNAREVSELETRYRTREREAEVAVQATQLASQRRTLWLVLGLLGVSLLGVGVVSWLALKLRRRTREREFLIHEVHHRVKNNLQVLSSLLYLQRKHVEDPAAIDAIQESQHRVEAMGLLHQRLYTRDQFAGVQVDDYLQELGDALLDSFGKDEVVLNYAVAPVELPVQTAIELGLIVNELLSNSLKYAFPDDDLAEARISITLNALGEGRYHFSVADNGAGTSAEVDENLSTGFGTQLVGLLSRKLGATPTVTANQAGYCTSFEFSA